MTSKFAIILLLLFPSVYSISQSNPIFSTFEGTVYKIPAGDLGSKFAYSEEVLAYEKIDSISWKEINFPDSQDTIPFPGVSIKKGFGIIFKSTMYITQSGTYGFTLNSDDGSAFWIEEEQIVNNEHPHGMRAKGGKTFLKKGRYPVTIWYFQAYPFRYGLQFTYKFLKAHPDTTSLQSYVLNNKALHFTNNSYLISEKGVITLDEIVSKLSDDVKKITIIGHTDNIGQAAANLKLSTNRAIAVSEQFQNLLANNAIEFSVIGKGEQAPIATNETEEGRRQNRRVEIIVEE